LKRCKCKLASMLLKRTAVSSSRAMLLKFFYPRLRMLMHTAPRWLGDPSRLVAR
jgi:hypothetical protein